jgi:hypothetical protein
MRNDRQAVELRDHITKGTANGPASGCTLHLRCLVHDSAYGSTGLPATSINLARRWLLLAEHEPGARPDIGAIGREVSAASKRRIVNLRAERLRFQIIQGGPGVEDVVPGERRGGVGV